MQWTRMRRLLKALEIALLSPTKSILMHAVNQNEGFNSTTRKVLKGVHLKEYPGLTEIHRSFENVLQEKYFSQKTNRKEKQKTFNTQQSCEKGN
ncbi:PREDICTED: nuclear body protein SP140-like protein isoform X4 [Chinchilla lanigera]|nr:PREDICTED: nuclear body protein SP140-like protein isoform X4 [Chinchilla lanigera]XP_013375270.1 PREDICTED: nuclear body protein SP140-like protein isoform X4 [Chinchilla lanigera]XP_013375271.1 PREDICTED: nuclear body protein SP140-like protein isoform X4 [Chinchilla lanigera]